MKAAYPIIMTQGETHIVVYVPDFGIGTQGCDIADAMEMARDAIGIMGIDMEDEGEALPMPTPLTAVESDDPGAVITLVDVDFTEYRRRHEMRTVRRSITLPGYLDDAAQRSAINVSAICRDAIAAELKSLQALKAP